MIPVPVAQFDMIKQNTCFSNIVLCIPNIEQPETKETSAARSPGLILKPATGFLWETTNQIGVWRVSKVVFH